MVPFKVDPIFVGHTFATMKIIGEKNHEVVSYFGHYQVEENQFPV